MTGSNFTDDEVAMFHAFLVGILLATEDLVGDMVNPANMGDKIKIDVFIENQVNGVNQQGKLKKIEESIW